MALARKLIRQHFEGGRTLETAGWGYLSNVLPAIDTYLTPSAATAHAILDGSLTPTQLVTEAMHYLASR